MTTQQYNQSVKAYSDRLYRFVLKNLRKEEAAKDIIQDVFMKVWLKKDTISGDKIKAYLFQTAYRTMLDHIKKNKRLFFEENLREEAYESSYSVDLQKHLTDALDKLPEIQKSVVLLRDYEGYSYAEIGEIVELNESQVKVYIYRARKALQKYLVRTELLV